MSSTWSNKLSTLKCLENHLWVFSELPLCPPCLDLLDSGASGVLGAPCHHQFQYSTKLYDHTMFELDMLIFRKAVEVYQQEGRSFIEEGFLGGIPLPLPPVTSQPRNYADCNSDKLLFHEVNTL